MIIWINGPFGVGKTATARLVCDQTGWRCFDPEHVGSMVAAHFGDVDVEDFQDLPSWRALVPTVAAEFRRRTQVDLVAVQTVLVEDYWTELDAGFAEHGVDVRLVLLDCDVDELRRRIETDEVEAGAKNWRLGHVARFDQNREWLVAAADTVIDTTALNPQEAAQAVITTARPTIGP